MGALRTTSTIAVIVAALFLTTASAFAHEGEDHGAAVQPVAPAAIPTVDEGVTGGGAVGGTPANGAQPAAPTDTLPPVVAGSVNNAGAAAVKVVEPVKVVTPAKPVAGAGTSGAVDSSAASTTTPKVDLESISEPVTTSVPKTASGGGGVMDNGASAVPDSAPVVTGGGELPFTGIEETVLLIALAGMLVPIGVLLYCGARRGDRTMYLRELAKPRFQWAPAPGVRPDGGHWPDARA
jgi:hypothetical protein